MDLQSSSPLSIRRETLKPGLYLVSTPIGNLRDITLRALDVLAGADVIACEDTRVSGKLLKAYDIKAKLISYNDHSDESKRAHILGMIKDGKAVALISDAGTPLISDPGYKLVRGAYDEGLSVTTLPGANAPLSALQLSALPSDNFSFIGFLPAKSGARQEVLREWADVNTTLIAFDTGPRLLKSLADILGVMGDRHIAIVREITKLYEESIRGKVSELLEIEQPKGEIVLVISPPDATTYSDADVRGLLLEALKGNPTKKAASIVAEQTGLPKSELYDLALALKNE